MMPYERFGAWQQRHRLVLQVSRVTRAFPIDERYGLTAQARRAAFPAAVNIAEGSAKRGKREFRRYLDITLGWSSELAYILRLAPELGLVTTAEWQEVDESRNRAGRLTWRLAQSMSRVKSAQSDNRTSQG
jgi:four helix bundle protein